MAGKYFEDELVDDEEFFPDPNNDIVEDDFQAEKKEKKKNHRTKATILVVFVVVALVLIGVAAYSVYNMYIMNRAPMVSTVHIESDNINGHHIAVYGNMITLSFSFNEEISNVPTVTIQNKKVEVFGSGKNFYAKYFVQQQGDVDEEVQFMIYNYQDELKKVGSPITATTDESKVTILAFS